MKKMVKCPICKEQFGDICTLATVEKAVGEQTYVYCCGSQERRHRRRAATKE